MLTITLSFGLPSPAFAGERLRDRIGGGNLVTHLAGKAQLTQLYSALHGVGVAMGRMNSDGWRTLDRKPTPHDFDAEMKQAHDNGITPIILLEYDGSYQTLDPPQPIGTYHDWFAAGQQMARRFRPDGEWARENGIVGWGATVFTAINEPDVLQSIPREAYHDALAGLADGVHSVDPALKVVPAGFATCNSARDATLRGYGPAIKDLLEDGRLDGIDLHTYYNDKYYPMTRGREFSAQTCFDDVKRAMGLQREIRFYSTEFNIARVGAWSDSKLAAKLFLSAFWDQVSVVGSDGRTPVMALAFPWNSRDYRSCRWSGLRDGGDGKSVDARLAFDRVANGVAARRRHDDQVDRQAARIDDARGPGCRTDRLDEFAGMDGPPRPHARACTAGLGAQGGALGMGRLAPHRPRQWR